MDTVVDLAANQPPERFYLGGQAIRDWRDGRAAAGDRVPEDWVGSMTTLFGEESLGLSVLPDGRLVRDAVEADPVFWLGQDHLDRFGVDPKLLVKLLDAGQRLPVHAHPHRSWAEQHLGRVHGKAEAWFALRPGRVHVGLQQDVSAADFLELINDQRVEEMLALLNVVDITAGQTVYVPPGTLHAVGEGNFVVEVQEPEDMSILTEWRDFALDGAADGHLGLGFEECVGALDLRAQDASQWVSAGSGLSVLAPGSEEYFRLGHVTTTDPVDVPATFAIVVPTRGVATLGTEQGETTLESGRTYLIAHAAGRLRLSGDADVCIIRPPA